MTFFAHLEVETRSMTIQNLHGEAAELLGRRAAELRRQKLTSVWPGELGRSERWWESIFSRTRVHGQWTTSEWWSNGAHVDISVHLETDAKHETARITLHETTGLRVADADARRFDDPMGVELAEALSTCHRLLRPSLANESQLTIILDEPELRVQGNRLSVTRLLYGVAARALGRVCSRCRDHARIVLRASRENGRVRIELRQFDRKHCDHPLLGYIRGALPLDECQRLAQTLGGRLEHRWSDDTLRLSLPTHCTMMERV